jgi:hypothetical protein
LPSQYAKMLHFVTKKSKKFSGEEHSPSPDPSPRGGVSPSPHPTPRRLQRLDSRAFGARFGHGRPKAWARDSCPLENQKTMKCRYKLRALRLAPSTLPLEKFLRADIFVAVKMAPPTLAPQTQLLDPPLEEAINQH